MPANIFSKLGYLVTGLGVGSVVSILLAPKSGEYTRTYLAERTKEAGGRIQKRAQALRGYAEELIEHSNGVVAQKKDQIVTAMKIGREVYRQEEFAARTRRRHAPDSTIGF